MNLRDERLARQQERFRNKGGFVVAHSTKYQAVASEQLTLELFRLSKFEKSANKLVLNLGSVIMKPEHVEGRVPPPQSPVDPLANSTAVKTAEDVATLITYPHSPLRPASNPSPVPSTAPPRQRATKPNASSSRPRKPQPTKKKTAPPPAKEAGQSDDDELALIVAPGSTPDASTRKSKHTTTAKPAPTKSQGSAKPLDDGAMEMQPVLKKKRHAKPSRALLKQAEVDFSPPKKGPSEPSPSALKPSKHKKTETKIVLRPEQRPETEGNVKHCATEAPSTRTQKRKTRVEELPAERPKCSGKAATSRSGIILSCLVVADGDENEAIQEPPKKQRRRVLIDQPCTWDAKDQAPRRVLKLPGHK